MGQGQNKENTNKEFDNLLAEYAKEAEIKSGHFDAMISIYSRKASPSKKMFLKKLLCQTSKEV